MLVRVRAASFLLPSTREEIAATIVKIGRLTSLCYEENNANMSETDVLGAVENNSEQIVSLLQELVQINTVNPYAGDADPGGEAAGQEYLAEKLEPLATDLHWLEVPQDIYTRSGVIGPAQRDFSGRPVLVTEFDFGGDGPTVVLNAHMDTVGADNMEIEPFSGEIRDGKLWGRGASDDKEGLSTIYGAIKSLLDSRAQLAGKIIFHSTIDEEANGSGAGALACLDAGYVGDSAIIVDGSTGSIAVGCNGCLTADVFVQGQEGHAARGKGISALEKALVVKTQIDEFAANLAARYPDCRVNIGIFEAGTIPAVIPGQARMSLSIVYPAAEAASSRESGTGWNGTLLRREFEESIAAACHRDDWLAEHPPTVQWVKDLIPFDQPLSLPLAEDLSRAYAEVTGNKIGVEQVTAWTESAYYQVLADMATVNFAPGQPGQPHGPREYVDIETVLDYTKTLTLYLYRALSVS